MKTTSVFLLIFMASFSANADWRAGLSGAAAAGAEAYRHGALMDQAHQLEMQRIEREFQLREKMIIRAEQRQRAAQIPPPTVNRQAAINQVEAVHPGWRNIASSEEFSHWRKRQPRSVDALGDSERPADAILMLDLFKRDQQK